MDKNKENHDKTIVVCGATGTQGNSVLKSLMPHSSGWRIVALSRNKNSPKSRCLQQKGIEVREADLEDRDSLMQAFRGAYGVFGVTQPWSADNRKCFPEKEVKQGKNIVDACITNRVSHLIYSSVLNFESKPIRIPHVDSKLEIEGYLKSKTPGYTILRFPQFMDNLGSSFFPVKNGLIKGFVDADAKVPYISSEDIGKFVTRALTTPNCFMGREISVIGDMVSGQELSQLMTSIRNGQAFKYKSVPKLLIRLFAKEFYTMRLFFETYGRAPLINIPERIFQETRAIQPGLTSMRDFLLQQRFDTKPLK